MGTQHGHVDRTASSVAACCALIVASSGNAGCSGEGDQPFGGGVGAGDVGGSGAGISVGAGGSGASSTGASGGSAAAGGIGTGGQGATGGVCANPVQPTEAAELDLLLVVDRSASMSEDDKWSATSSAVQSFVSASESSGIAVGLQYFPVPPEDPPTLPGTCAEDDDCGLYGPCVPMMYVCGGFYDQDASCDPIDYRTPDEPMGLLPGAGAALVASLQDQDALGSITPTEPALQGATSYALGWAAAHTSHTTAIVLVTDGGPTSCTYNTVAGAASEAAAAWSAPERVGTFVIAIGYLDVSLDPIAQAGGTGLPRAVAAGSQQELLSELADIRDSRRCSYPIPPPLQGPLNLGLVNVVLTDPTEPLTPSTVPNVMNQAGCNSSTGGWFYDDPTDPQRVVLCPASCVEATSASLEVGVVHGCPSQG